MARHILISSSIKRWRGDRDKQGWEQHDRCDTERNKNKKGKKEKGNKIAVSAIIEQDGEQSGEIVCYAE